MLVALRRAFERARPEIHHSNHVVQYAAMPTLTC